MADESGFLISSGVAGGVRFVNLEVPPQPEGTFAVAGLVAPGADGS